MKNHYAKSLSLFLLWLISCSAPSADTSIKVRFAQDPGSLHPLSYDNALALQILNYVHQSLLTVDLETKQIQPLLAADLPRIQRRDTVTYFTYSIRPEAKWDNGAPITAQDVAFSLKLLHSPNLDNERWRAQYEFIQDILPSKENVRSFTLVCSGYTPEMKLMSGDFFVLPAYLLDPKGLLTSVPYRLVREKFDSLAQTSTFKTFASSINTPEMARDTSLVKGSGPYKLVKWSSGQAILLNKKLTWWGKDVSSAPSSLQAIPSHITIQIQPDNAAAILALKAQQLDVMDNLPLVSFLEMRQDKKFQQLFNFYTPDSYELVFMGVNGQSELLSDRLTRQALAHLVNIPQIITSLQGDLATPSIGLIHPQEKEYYNNDLPLLKFDKEKAKSLLKAAGWQQAPAGWQKKINGRVRQLKLELLHRAGNTDFENMGLLFQQNARTLGIPVVLQALESSQISDRLHHRKYDLFIRTLAGNPFSYNLIPLLHTSNAKAGGGNVTSFGNPQTDLLLKRIAEEEWQTEKASLLKTLQERMQEESNMIFLYFLKNKIVVSKRIDSVVVSSLKPGYDLTKFSIKNKQE